MKSTCNQLARQISFILGLILVVNAHYGWAQSNLNFKYFGLSVHPKGDPNAPLMPLNPDKKGYLVFNLGGMLSYEKFWKPQKYSFKAIQALYTDCAALLGGFTHMGVRAIIFQNKQHSVSGGLGPTFIYRRNWYRLPGYQDSGFFDGTPHSAWQYKFIPYAGELEYNYQLTDKMDFSTTFVPGYPSLISLSFGLRYWFNKESVKQQNSLQAPVSALP
ncbi:hypothetical protein [Adhaeribacter pallidiroseus]|uniref:Outer membrane protein beta-barrel domain-containing protein n=1 Tax=Adhaeribacter pallidiroseus TaxID=2072847 RepID=A0A369QK47_9BACT|nr:hypothetical protein [Adhaeribacter pallidiroseus]RDC63229.1 hypothetical protein AHMF7616_01830 [Adhaeribacter pallidiroseus]